MNTYALTILEARKEAANWPLTKTRIPFTSSGPKRVPSAIYGEDAKIDKSKLVPGFAANGSQLAGRPAENPMVQASIPQSVHDAKAKSLAMKDLNVQAMQAVQRMPGPSAAAAQQVGPQPIPAHLRNTARTMSDITGRPRQLSVGSRATEISAPKVAQYLALAVLRGRTVT